MIKIKVCDVAPRGACSYYRGMGVLTKLSKIDSDIQIEYLESVSWMALSDADILFLVRPVENNYIEAMQLAQDLNIPVWSDFDDNLSLVPEDNPAHEYYNQKHIKKNLEYTIKNSNIVTVSTKHLKDYYKHLNPYIKVIENAFNDYNFQLGYKENNNKIISWRGTNTHRKDLMTIAESMVEIAKEKYEWSWAFMGYEPWYITENIKNSKSFKLMEIIEYKKFINELSPMIQIVPLVDSIFNRCKSNIAWIEATVAGAACIAPDMPEFNKPGITNYKTKKDFELRFKNLLNNPVLIQNNYKESLKYINKKLLLSDINKKRIEIIYDALGINDEKIL